MKIVFVHLGPAECGHLISNIQRFSEIFPKYEVHLVTSPNTRIVRIPEFVNTHVYVPQGRADSLFGSLAQEQKFRQGFWRYSLERILAIRMVHEKFPLESIIHFESDILIMPNFPFDEISKSRSLMWNMYNVDHDVSAILFSPSAEETIKLEEAIFNKIEKNRKLTDMTVLNEIWRDSNLNVQHFGSICADLGEMKNALATPLVKNGNEVGYGGIFDGASIGMWLLGHDPRNNYGKSIIHSDSVLTNGNSYVDPSAISYDLNEKGELYAVSKYVPSKRIPIWNLHVHSKNNKLLSTHWEPELRRYLELAKSADEIVIMEWSIVWRMLITSLKTRTLLNFLLGIPQLQFLRRKLAPLKRLVINQVK